MQNLPSASVYEKEFRYMPWGILMKEIQDLVIRQAPKNAAVLDLLCGPGYLLAQLQRRRVDLRLTGVDMEKEFIEYAQKQYQNMELIVADAAAWTTSERFDVILCTGGLHHLRYEVQESFIKKLAELLKDDGFTIVADPYIDEYTDELSRKLAGAKLGYEYLKATIENGADNDVIRATVGIIQNDALLVEYKNSIQRNKPLFERYFSHVEIHKTWPTQESGFGDYYFILKK